MSDEEKIKPHITMRDPFLPNQISKLPKGTKAQNQCDANEKVNCKICGGWHHPRVIHLDYVGHAALTDRLLDVDPNWFWEPLALDNGLPAFDKSGGLWIKLTINGVTRIGYGNAESRANMDVGSREKEVIGDCLVTGTLITTARGVIPIESVVVGDFVPTRAGWHPVIDHWLSARSVPVVTVKMSDGRSITGTPRHKVPTLHGDKRLSALRSGDIMHGWLDTENYRAQKKLSGAAAFIDATPSTSRLIGNVISCQRLPHETTCIATFTKQNGTKSLPSGTFITRMGTGTTTALTILSRLIQEATRTFMPLLAPELTGYATSAGSLFPLPSVAPVGALPRAKSGADDATAWRMFGPEHPLSYENFDARNAGRHSNQQNHGPAFAPLTVVEVSDAGYGDVWNLSVDEMHEYVANGVLVYNCLRNAAMRFGAALDLWHKGKLHADEDEEPVDTLTVTQKKQVLEDTLSYLANGDEVGLAETWHGWNADQMIVLNSMFNSEQRAAIKNMQIVRPMQAHRSDPSGIPPKAAVPPKQGEKLSTITLDQAALLDQLVKDAESDRGALLSYYKITSLEQLPAYLFGHAHEALRDRVKRKEAKISLKQGSSENKE